MSKDIVSWMLCPMTSGFQERKVYLVCAAVPVGVILGKLVRYLTKPQYLRALGNYWLTPWTVPPDHFSRPVFFFFFCSSAVLRAAHRDVRTLQQEMMRSTDVLETAKAGKGGRPISNNKAFLSI